MGFDREKRAMAMDYRIINGDGHIDLNPDLWRDRVAKKFRDRAPRSVRLPHGSDAVVTASSAPIASLSKARR